VIMRPGVQSSREFVSDSWAVTIVTIVTIHAFDAFYVLQTFQLTVVIKVK